MANRSYTVSIDADTSGLERGKRQAQALVSEVQRYKATVQLDADATKLDQRIHARATQVATRLDDQRMAAQVATGARNRLQAAGVNLAPDAEEKQFQAWLQKDKGGSILGLARSKLGSLVAVGALARTADSMVAASGAYESTYLESSKRYSTLGAYGEEHARNLASISGWDTATRDLQRLPILGTALAAAFDKARASAIAVADTQMQLAHTSSLLNVRSAQIRGDPVSAAVSKQGEEMKEAEAKLTNAKKDRDALLASYGWKPQYHNTPGAWAPQTIARPDNAQVAQADANVAAAEMALKRLQSVQRKELSGEQRTYAAEVQGLMTRRVGANLSGWSANQLASGNAIGAYVTDMATEEINFRTRQKAELAKYTPGTELHDLVKSAQGAEYEAFTEKQKWSVMQYGANTPFALTTSAFSGAGSMGNVSGEGQAAALLADLNKMVAAIAQTLGVMANTN